MRKARRQKCRLRNIFNKFLLPVPQANEWQQQLEEREDDMSSSALKGQERGRCHIMTKQQVNGVTTVTKPRDGAGKRAESGPDSASW